MSKYIIWKLIPKVTKIDMSVISTKIANEQDINLKDFEVQEVPYPIDTFSDEFIDFIISYGLTRYLQRGMLTEEVVKKGTTTNIIIPLIEKYLERIEIDSELIIVDGYFYHKPKISNYLQFFSQIFDKYIPTLSQIYIITNKHFDLNIKNQIESYISSKNKAIKIYHNISNDYHDRFWISNKRSKGILVGTSLNSIGNKLALLDTLKSSDITDIVNELLKDNLIS